MPQLTVEQVKVRTLLERWASGAHGIYLYDFGEGITKMPLPDTTSGSYLTSSIAFIMTKPNEELPKDFVFPRQDEGLKDYGDGLRVIPVVMSTHASEQDWVKNLEQAKEKLLAAR